MNRESTTSGRSKLIQWLYIRRVRAKLVENGHLIDRIVGIILVLVAIYFFIWLLNRNLADIVYLS